MNSSDFFLPEFLTFFIYIACFDIYTLSLSRDATIFVIAYKMTLWMLYMNVKIRILF